MQPHLAINVPSEDGIPNDMRPTERRRALHTMKYLLRRPLNIHVETSCLW
jgi:hypothetical protein